MAAFAKTICSICYEDLKPISEDLQSISICGHVFHELCLQQWFEYAANAKKCSCPVCKQGCKADDAGRLYFQSVDPGNTQRAAAECGEEDSEELREEVNRLELKVVGLNSALERQGQGIKELKDELWLCKEQAKKEIALKNEAVVSKNEALTQKASIERMFHMKSGELDKVTMECLRLQEKNMKLAKELAAIKLVSDFDLKEEEVLNYAALGNGVNNKESIDSLKKSLLSRERVYQVHAKNMTARYNELMKKHRDLAQDKAHSSGELEKAKEKINVLKTRVQELETSIEVKDNVVLRSLKTSRGTRDEYLMSNCVRKSDSLSANNSSHNQRKHLYAPVHNFDRNRRLPNDPLCQTVNTNFINPMDSNHTKDDSNTITHDEERDTFCLDDDASKCTSSMHGLSDPNLKEQLRECSTNQKSSLRSGTVSDAKKEASVCRIRNLDQPLSSTTGPYTDTAKTPAAETTEVFILDDVEEVHPVLNIIKESPTPQTVTGPGNACFSGGLLGLDGPNRLGKWCKQSLNNGSVTRQESSTHTSSLIAVGTDGRGGRIKVLRKQTTLDDTPNSRRPKRCKYGAKTNSLQSQGCLQMEHFFGRAGK